MAEQKMELIHPLRRNHIDVSYIHLVLEKERVGSCLGKAVSSYPLILDGSMLIRVANPKLVSLSVVVKHPSRQEVVIRGIGDIRINRTVRTRGVHDGLLMVIIRVQRCQKGRLLGMTQWTCHRPFKVRAVFAGLRNGECV